LKDGTEAIRLDHISRNWRENVISK